MFKQFFGGLLNSNPLNNLNGIKTYWKYVKEKSFVAKKIAAGVARDFLVVFVRSSFSDFCFAIFKVSLVIKRYLDSFMLCNIISSLTHVA